MDPSLSTNTRFRPRTARSRHTRNRRSSFISKTCICRRVARIRVSCQPSPRPEAWGQLGKLRQVVARVIVEACSKGARGRYIRTVRGHPRGDLIRRGQRGRRVVLNLWDASSTNCIQHCKVASIIAEVGHSMIPWGYIRGDWRWRDCWKRCGGRRRNLLF